MKRRWLALAAAIALVPVWGVMSLPADAQAPAQSGNAVFDRTVDLVNEHFFAPSALPGFNQAAALVASDLPGLDTAEPAIVGDAVAFALDSLHASHTGRFTADRVDYYELADIFRFALRHDMRRLFPPRGVVSYAGIGIASSRIDGKSFVSDVYDDGPAARAGLMTGDEIVAVDGEPFAEIGSFRGKAGKTAQLMVRRAANAQPIAIDVPVAEIQPSELFAKAISDSVTRLDQDGRRIGYIHLWTYTVEGVTQTLYDELGKGRLKDVDGLVLDLRSKWGGAPGEAADIFLGRAADMVGVNRDGSRTVVTFRWHKPVVAIIDGGTRSGMEALAYSLKKSGVPLVGTPTAGNVLAGTTYLLPDDSILELAVADVLVDGQHLEGNPVEPDVFVPFDLRYAGGFDPQREAATALMADMLADGTGGAD